MAALKDVPLRVEIIIITVDSRMVAALAVLQVKPSAVKISLTSLDQDIEGY